MIRIRASSLSKIMTEPKSKDETLSVGAKTFVTELAKEYVYGYHKTISSKEMEKGIMVEQDSIDLYNSVFFTSHEKNIERKSNEWITGECDIFTGRKIVDIKSSWSIPTFPATCADGMDKGYEWQLRAYMMLWNVDEAEIAYCLVNTPDELIGYESPELHYVDNINPALRVTVVPYKRDPALEDKIRQKVEAANKYLDQLVELINFEHNV